MSDEFHSNVGGQHEDWGAHQKLVIYRLDQQDESIASIYKRLEEVNKVREHQHTENQVAFSELKGAIKNLTEKVMDTEKLKKAMVGACGLALLTAILNLVVTR